MKGRSVYAIPYVYCLLNITSVNTITLIPGYVRLFERCLHTLKLIRGKFNIRNVGVKFKYMAKKVELLWKIFCNEQFVLDLIILILMH